MVVDIVLDHRTLSRLLCDGRKDVEGLTVGQGSVLSCTCKKCLKRFVALDPNYMSDVVKELKEAITAEERIKTGLAAIALTP